MLRLASVGHVVAALGICAGCATSHAGGGDDGARDAGARMDASRDPTRDAARPTPPPPPPPLRDAGDVDAPPPEVMPPVVSCAEDAGPWTTPCSAWVQCTADGHYAAHYDSATCDAAGRCDFSGPPRLEMCDAGCEPGPYRGCNEIMLTL